jgi:hypothetical protein
MADVDLYLAASQIFEMTRRTVKQENVDTH